MFKILIFCLIIKICSANNSPVFLWGSATSSISTPSLDSLNKLDFIEYLEPELKSAMFLVFLEEDLETEDLTLCKRSNGKTCFTNLSNYKSKSFLSDVEEPVQALNLIVSKHESVIINDNGKLEEDIKYEYGKIVLVKFEKNEGEERSNVLKEHDAIISNIYDQLASNGNVIGIYTSKQNMNAKHRVRRQGSVDTDEASGKVEGTKHEAEGVLMYWTKVTVKSGTEASDITVSGIVKSNPTDNSFDLAFTGADLTCTVSTREGYWIVNNTVLKGEPVPELTYAFNGFSYYCGKQTFVSKNNSITFHDFQMQVQFGSGEPLVKFGDPYHCDGFMSIGILMGLFVGFIYLIILSLAITWIMDINANDRFEDPKGKTIVVTQET